MYLKSFSIIHIFYPQISYSCIIILISKLKGVKMIKVDNSNIDAAKQFILKHLNRSSFMYGNLLSSNSESYILSEDDKIIAMSNVIDSMYITYLFPQNTPDHIIRTVIEFMSRIKHIGGTVTGDYLHIFKEYYNLPKNAINEVAYINVESTECNNSNVQYINASNASEYKKSIDQISEFNVRSIEELTKVIANNQVVVIKEDNQIVSSATLNAISDKTAVITSVFTLEDYQSKGYAKACINQLLTDYALNRTILIFFSNPIAKKLYLDLGFNIEDQLIMFNEKIDN